MRLSRADICRGGRDQSIFSGWTRHWRIARPEEPSPLGAWRYSRLAPLHAILVLRNETAHGGLPQEANAADTPSGVYPAGPPPHVLLQVFDFLALLWVVTPCVRGDHHGAGT